MIQNYIFFHLFQKYRCFDVFLSDVTEIRNFTKNGEETEETTHYLVCIKYGKCEKLINCIEKRKKSEEKKNLTYYK